MSSQAERIRQIRESEELGRGAFAAKIGVSARTIETVENKVTNPRGEILAAIASKYPQYSLWMLTGKTDPKTGQISPHTEKIRKTLPQGRTGTK